MNNWKVVVRELRLKAEAMNKAADGLAEAFGEDEPVVRQAVVRADTLQHKRRRLSAAGRRAISMAMKRRWALQKRNHGGGRLLKMKSAA